MPASSLVHLSGPARGTTWPLCGGTVHVVAASDGMLPYATRVQPGDGERLFSLRRTPDGHAISEPPDRPVWVNGTRARDLPLANGDLIEVGNGGPVLRYRRSPSRRGYKSLREAFSDCIDSSWYGGRGFLDRFAILVFGPAREIGAHAAPVVRATILLGLAVLAASVAALWIQNHRLERELAQQLDRVEGLERLLAGSENAEFSRDDFNSARGELDFRIDDALSRVEALENRAGARGRVIATAARSVVFLQAAYGFLDPDSGRPLRGVADRLGPGSLTLAGDGPELEIRYTGTGFMIGDRGRVLTNRHVAVPWEFDESARALIARGFTPAMRRFLGYLPDQAEPCEIRPVATHELADIALLVCLGEAVAPRGLELATRPPEIGEEVVVLGYPTGLRALLARAGTEFVDEVMASGRLDFWELGERLATAGLIDPLATAGVVGQNTPGAVVYDAETTHGGSGGPVLALDGTVLAVNAAVLPDFGGSNLGVPAAVAAELRARHAELR